MTAPLFLVPAERLAGDVVVVDGADGRHAAAVRRIAPGEYVLLGDGCGAVATGEVVSAGRDALSVRVVDRRVESPPQPRLVVVQALAKGGRDEDAVAAMTEVGVDEFVPWAASRSVVRWEGARGVRALERWRATAREAAKQSRRAWVPVVRPLASVAEVSGLLGAATLGVVLHEAAQEPLARVDPPASGDVVVVVGPEGGLSDAELAGFRASGAAAYRLGSSVLRTSTSGVAAVAVLVSRTGRWG